MGSPAGRRRVVITGMGAVTPLGNSVAEYWDSLKNGRSGAGPITLFDTTDFATKIAAEVKDFDPTAHIDRKMSRRMDRFCMFAVSATAMAMEDAGLSDLSGIDVNRVGVVVGSGIGGMTTFESNHTALVEEGPRRISPLFIPMMIADISPGYISIIHGLKGPNYATTSACATASHAIGDACRIIERGDADIMISGGSEASVTAMGVGGFNAMRALSTRNDEPERASRPFDKDRDGFVNGEGSGIVVLESLEHALQRNARILAEIGGLGFTADAYHLTAPAPDGDGAMRAMQTAIADAGLQPEDVDYVNAHGTSTGLGDIAETLAIKRALGDHAQHVYISSTKSMTGHLLGAAGGIELIATALAVQHGIIPPTINLETPDPECDLNYTPNTAVEKPVRNALSNTFGFGGHNASILVKQYS
jgi:3-oxoacyl-[acyl-carrier-protein] synthase II